MPVSLEAGVQQGRVEVAEPVAKPRGPPEEVDWKGCVASRGGCEEGKVGAWGGLWPVEKWCGQLGGAAAGGVGVETRSARINRWRRSMGGTVPIAGVLAGKTSDL